MRVAIVGAAGLPGTIVRQLLIERDFPLDGLRFLEPGRSPLTSLRFRDEDILVENTSAAELAGIDVALLLDGELPSRNLANELVAAGALVIDSSSTWRLDDDVPLVVAEVNPDALRCLPAGIVAIPSSAVSIITPVLKSLHDAAGLTSVMTTVLQAVSGEGQAGIDELEGQLGQSFGLAPSLALDGQAIRDWHARVFPEVIAHNVIPLVGHPSESGETAEERGFREEVRKVLLLPELPVDCTCIRAPVFTGHSMSITVGLAEPLTVLDVHKLLVRAKGVWAVDLPTPLKAAGSNPTLVGRIRIAEGVENGVSLFASGDNLRRGVALNAVQTAELIAELFFGG